MKCIRCGVASRLQERPDGKCIYCKGAFAFEPQEGDPLTDWAFAKALKKVSGEGHIQFYPEHLFYQVTNLPPKSYLGERIVLWLMGLLNGIGCVYSIFAVQYLMAFGAMAVALLTIIMSEKILKKNPISKEVFDNLWQKWINTHGYPPGLISTKDQTKIEQPFGKELLLYSFDRAVICDNSKTVDILLANRFHFEHNCAILGIEGYPSEVFETVKAMLKNNSKLQIYVLHDCTLKGCLMAQQLATDPHWFRGQGQVIDVGLRPIQAKRFKKLWQKVESQSPLQPHMFSAYENRWLTQYQLELAVVPPDKLMKLLYNAFTHYQDAGGAGGDVIYVGTDTDGSSGGGEIDGFG